MTEKWKKKKDQKMPTVNDPYIFSYKIVEKTSLNWLKPVAFFGRTRTRTNPGNFQNSKNQSGTGPDCQKPVKTDFD